MGGKIRSISCAALLLAASFPALAEPSSDAKLLTKQELIELYVGKTLRWFSGRGEGRYEAGGTYSWNSYSGGTGKGKWRATDKSELCLIVPAFWKNDELCWTIHADDSKIHIYDQKKNEWKERDRAEFK